MRFPLKLLSLAALGVALIGVAPADANHRGHGRGGYWVDPPPRYVPARPRHWQGPRHGYGYHAPPPRVYYPPPRAYYPAPRHYAPPPGAGFYFRF
ncbi:MAG TPA: hypothetical protein VGN83_24905 [Falsiroseomonas sp.]|jgi:hypothetical protein|nr:hypothetical protein [Falsiroseomonas sp.]